MTVRHTNPEYYYCRACSDCTEKNEAIKKAHNDAIKERQAAARANRMKLFGCIGGCLCVICVVGLAV